MRRKTQSGPTCRVWGAGSADETGELHFPPVPRCRCCPFWALSQEAALLAAGGPSLWPQFQVFCLLHSGRGRARLPQVTLPWAVAQPPLAAGTCRSQARSLSTHLLPLIPGSHGRWGRGPVGECHSWFCPGQASVGGTGSCSQPGPCLRRGLVFTAPCSSPSSTSAV